MRPAEVVDALGSQPPSSDIDSRRPAALSGTLASVVQQKPDVYAPAAAELKRLNPTHLRGALNGFASAIQAGRAFDWKPVTELCAWTACHPAQIAEREDLPSGVDANWGHARHDVLLLLSEGLTSTVAPIPVELRDIVWSAIQPALDDPDDAEGMGKTQAHPIDHLLNRGQGLAMVTTPAYAP